MAACKTPICPATPFTIAEISFPPEFLSKLSYNEYTDLNCWWEDEMARERTGGFLGLLSASTSICCTVDHVCMQKYSTDKHKTHGVMNHLNTKMKLKLKREAFIPLLSPLFGNMINYELTKRPGPMHRTSSDAVLYPSPS